MGVSPICTGVDREGVWQLAAIHLGQLPGNPPGQLQLAGRILDLLRERDGQLPVEHPIFPLGLVGRRPVPGGTVPAAAASAPAGHVPRLHSHHQVSATAVLPLPGYVAGFCCSGGRFRFVPHLRLESVNGHLSCLWVQGEALARWFLAEKPLTAPSTHASMSFASCRWEGGPPPRLPPGPGLRPEAANINIDNQERSMPKPASEWVDRFTQTIRETTEAIDRGELSDDDLGQVLDLIEGTRIGIEEELARRDDPK